MSDIYKITYGKIGDRFISSYDYDTNLDYNIIWQYETNNVELIAGMAAGSFGILYGINKDNYDNYYIDTNIDISNFRIKKGIYMTDIPKISCGVLSEGMYGLWIRNYNNYNYNLYQFTDMNFIRGLISICNSFNKNFMDYIYGVIFDSNNNTYTLENYVMSYYNTAIDVPDYIDVDEEREDDENVIQPIEVDHFGDFYSQNFFDL